MVMANGTQPMHASTLAGRLEHIRVGGKLADASALLSRLPSDGLISAHLLDVEAAVGLDDGTRSGAAEAERFRRVLESGLAGSSLTTEKLKRWHAIAVGHRPNLAPGEFRGASSSLGDADLRGPGWTLPQPAGLGRRIEELIEYANGRHDHPILAAAVLMGELEAIRPFVTGNGRMARALFHWAMSNQGGVVWPVSVRWAARPTRLRVALDSWRTGSDPSLWPRSVIDDLLVVGTACSDLHEGLAELQTTWLERGGGRTGSLRRKMLRDLPARPVVDSAGATLRMGADPSRFSRVARQLVDEGILVVQPQTPGKVGRPAVRYEAPVVLEFVKEWVERLAMSEGTPGRASRPAARPIPESPSDPSPTSTTVTRGRPVPSKARRSS